MGGVEERHLQMVNSLRAVNSQQESKASGIPGADTPSPPRTQLTGLLCSSQGPTVRLSPGCQFADEVTECLLYQ